MLEHVRPLYAKKFRCIGGKCEDNCCHTWEVDVDKATYQKYQATPALQKMLSESLVLTNKRDDSKFAAIHQVSSSDCPMHLSDGLCRIHKEFGEAYLSKTCATYPRVSRRVDGLFEHALLLSCPEAARLVLLDPQLLPRKKGCTEENRYAPFLVMTDEGNPEQADPMRFFWDGREFSLLLVQDHSYPLWQRLFILGMLCKRWDAITADPRAGSISKLLREYAEIVSRGQLRSAMDGIPVRPEAQVKMVLEVVSFQLLSDRRLSRFRECLQDFLRGTGHDDSAQKLSALGQSVTFPVCLEKCTHHYVEAYERYYAPFMENYPYLLENYLINYIIRTNFPHRVASQDQTISTQQQFVLMCIEFSAIKGLLIGIAGHYREVFSTDHVVKLIQVVAKSIEHFRSFRTALNWEGLADSNSVAALLRN